MSKTRILVLLILILSLCCQAQNQDSLGVRFTAIEKSNLSDSLKIMTIKNLVAQSTQASDSLLGSIYHRLGLLYYRTEQYEDAVLSTQKAIVFRQAPGQDATPRHNSQYNLSFYYNALGQTQNRIAVLNQLVNDQNPDRFTYRSLIELGYYYSDLGDYFKSIESFQLVINGADIHKDDRTLGLGYLGLIYVMSLLDAPELIQWPYTQYIEEAISLSQSVTPAQMASFNTNVGRIYEQLEQPEQSAIYYTKALAFYKQTKDPETTAILLNNLGSAKAGMGQVIAASELFHEALALTNTDQTRSVLYDNLGYYLAAQDTQRAKKFFEKAIMTATNQGALDVFKPPSYEHLKQVNNKSSLLRILTDYAQFLYDQSTAHSNKDFMVAAKEIVLLADMLVTLIRDETQIEQSKLFWIGRGVNIYMLGVRISYSLRDTQSAFYFMEKNKAILLLENINRLHSREHFSIPKHTLTRQQSLQQRLTKSSHQFLNDPSTANRERYYTDFTGYNSFMDSLKMAFPDYINRGRFLKIQTLEAIAKDYVNDQTAILTYILDDNHGFGIYTDQAGSEFFEFSDIPSLLNDIKEVVVACKSPFVKSKERTAYWQQSYRLFTKVLPLTDARQRINNKLLIVAPDYALQALSFEALTTQGLTDNAAQLPYLITNTRVAYLHSFSVNAQIEKAALLSKKQSMLAVTPEEFLTDTLTKLQRSKKEAAYLNQYFTTTQLTKNQASKSALLTNLGEFDLIHFSTHAGYQLKQQQPWLAMHDSIIRLEELYTVSTKAQLVTLGACKTAEGFYAKGEGALSLSRAFFITGSQAVLASLWNANEKSNEYILEQFYANLNDGESKDFALHRAKLSYLKEHQLTETSPYYWANLTITGKLAAIGLKTNNAKWLWVLGLGLLLFIAYFFARQKRATA